MNYIKFGVVIVTFNRLELLKECLQCVKSQKNGFSSILVVDNCSTDGTGVFLDSIKDKDKIEVLHVEKNLGGSGGFEIGVKAIANKVDYLLLIDDDAMLQPDFLLSINNHIVPEISAYSGTVKTDGNIDTTHRRIVTNNIFLKKSDVQKSEYQKDYFDYDLSSFCGLCFKTSLIDKVGYPEGKFFIWYDDTEYSLRLSKFTKIRNVNSAVIYHKTVISNEEKLNWKSFYGYRNMIETGKRHSSFPLLFCLMRYVYHLYRGSQYKLYYILKGQSCKKYYLMASKLHFRVLSQSIQGKLGIDDVFKPGIKF